MRYTSLRKQILRFLFSWVLKFLLYVFAHLHAEVRGRHYCVFFNHSTCFYYITVIIGSVVLVYW